MTVAEARAVKRPQTACFTGHREISHAMAETVQKRTRETVLGLINRGYRYFGAGGARGYDAMAAEIVLELRRQHPDIHLILVLPFRDQYRHEKGWTQQEIEQYHSLQERASKVVVLQEEYSPGVYYKRNRRLVDCSSACVAYMTRTNSGTSYTVDYARSNGLSVINVAGSR